MSTPKVIIVGGGIAGTTLALSLIKLGISTVKIFEQAHEIKPLGAGLALAPNSLQTLKVLDEDIYKKVDQVSAKLTDIHVHSDYTKQKLADHNMRFVNNMYNYSLSFLERRELQDILIEALPKGILSLGKKLTQIEQDNSGVRVSFQDGTTEEGDILIGADGIHSVVRKYISGKNAESTYIGKTCILGLSEPMDVVPEGNGVWVLGTGEEWGTYSLKNGKQYWFYVEKNESASSENWSHEAVSDIERIKHKYWPFNVNKMIDNTKRIIKIGLYNTTPLSSWTNKRVCVIGDAAHAMLPNAGQGANMGIEDATVLAYLIANRGSNDSLDDVLTKYQIRRKARTENIAKVAFQVAQLQMPESWFMIKFRDFFYSYVQHSSLRWFTDWVFRYQPTIKSI